MEEAKHAEFFMRWHDEVAGVPEPEEVARHFSSAAIGGPERTLRGPRRAPRGAPPVRA